MTRNHRDRHHAGANDGGRSDLPALAIEALPGIWSTCGAPGCSLASI